jgi:hypothetical protein
MLPDGENLGGLAMGGCILIAFGFLRLLAKWIQDASVGPDPWEQEVGQATDSPDVPEVCHRCSAPQAWGAWFCPHCGSAVGPYNNLMPYVNVFSQGEVLRNGATDRFRMRPLILIGYLLVSLEGYLIFAPVYWFFLLRNLRCRRDAPPQSAEAPNA